MSAQLDRDFIGLLSESMVLLDTRGSVIASNLTGQGALAQWHPHQR